MYVHMLRGFLTIIHMKKEVKYMYDSYCFATSQASVRKKEEGRRKIPNALIWKRERKKKWQGHFKALYIYVAREIFLLDEGRLHRKA